MKEFGWKSSRRIVPHGVRFLSCVGGGGTSQCFGRIPIEWLFDHHAFVGLRFHHSRLFFESRSCKDKYLGILLHIGWETNRDIVQGDEIQCQGKAEKRRNPLNHPEPQ